MTCFLGDEWASGPGNGFSWPVCFLVIWGQITIKTNDNTQHIWENIVWIGKDIQDMDIWRSDTPDDLSQSPSKWLFEHFEEFADWMTETQTYEQYLHEHAAEPENPVCPKKWHVVAEIV